MAQGPLSRRKSIESCYSLKMDQDLFKRLDAEYIGELYQQIIGLHHDRAVLTEVMTIIAKNKRIKPPNAFIDGVRRHYGTAIIIGIRKLIDPGKSNDSISFITLLRKLKKNPDVI